MVSSKHGGEQIKLADRRRGELRQVDWCKYLGSLRKGEGGCEADMWENKSRVGREGCFWGDL